MNCPIVNGTLHRNISKFIKLVMETFDSFDFGSIAVNEQSSMKDGRRKFLQILKQISKRSFVHFTCCIPDSNA